MKKFLLLLLTVVMSITAWAEEETLSFTTSNNGIVITKAGAGEPGGDVELSKGVITVTSAGGQAPANKALQIYKTKSMTVSVPSAYVITKIDFTYATSCYPFSEAIPTDLANATTKTASGKQEASYTPSVSASEITFTNIAGGQTKINKMTVTYEASGEGIVNVTGVSIDHATASVNVGETTSLVATVAPANATNKNVTWTSDNTDVATVSNTGVVTGVAVGTANITATTTDGAFKATCAVTVKAVAVTGITLDQTSLTLMEGKKATLVATIAPANAANKTVVWVSDNDDVATVSEEGVVTAVAEGTTTITAITEDGEFEATCAVTVTPYVEPNEWVITFAPSSTNSDSSTTWTKDSNVEKVFTNGYEYVSSITDADKVYPARNSLTNGAKFGTSSVAGTITFSLTKSVYVEKIIVSAAPYGETEGKEGFILNGKSVAMEEGKNKVYADYEVAINDEISEITLTHNTGKRIYVEGMTIVKGTAPTSATVTVSAAGYATFYDSKNAVVLPAGMTGYVFTEGKIEEAYAAEETVPAGEPIVVKAEAGEYTLNYTTSSEETYKSADMNDLYGTDNEELTAVAGTNCYYGLSLNASGDPESVGFYWMEEDGAAFTNGAHKAFLALPKSAAKSRSYVFKGEATAIKGISELKANKVAYNLNGQRVNAIQKGITVVEGKKFVK